MIGFYFDVTVPGEPQDVRVNAINSTTLHVIWKPPQEKDRNGIIMGYHIHVQETKEEVCFDEFFFSYFKRNFDLIKFFVINRVEIS